MVHSVVLLFAWAMLIGPVHPWAAFSVFRLAKRVGFAVFEEWGIRATLDFSVTRTELVRGVGVLNLSPDIARNESVLFAAEFF